MKYIDFFLFFCVIFALLDPKHWSRVDRSVTHRPRDAFCCIVQRTHLPRDISYKNFRSGTHCHGIVLSLPLWSNAHCTRMLLVSPNGRHFFAHPLWKTICILAYILYNIVDSFEHCKNRCYQQMSLKTVSVVCALRFDFKVFLLLAVQYMEGEVSLQINFLVASRFWEHIKNLDMRRFFSVSIKVCCVLENRYFP
jgi:hypothetical protein